MKRNEDEVYVIGKNNKSTKKRRKKLFAYLVSLAALFVALLFMVYSYSRNDCGQKPKAQELQAVNVLHDDAKAPLFMGRHDMKEFIAWMSEQVKYPKGHELEDARVVVTFVITKEGTLDSISIISQPTEKIFGEEVVKILQRCPRWEAGKLADGSPISIRYILPINFKKQRSFNQ